MEFDFNTISRETRYKLLGSTIVPRPIAWVSTLDAQGVENVAPFSFFNVFGEDPATVGFSILHRSETDIKDTGVNIRERKEFVVNLVSEDLFDAMLISAVDYEPGVSEFKQAGLVSVPSSRIKTPRIGGSRVSMECKLVQIIELGALRSLVIGEVLTLHIEETSVIDVQRGWINTESLKLIGRMGPNRYVRTADTIEGLVPPKSAVTAAQK